jgi:polyhydroxyalkanoate synthesis regulator phasin
MATNDRLQRYLEAGRAWTELTRQQAESMVKDLVRAGEVQQDRAKKAVDDLLERSRRNTEELSKMIRKEIKQQVSALGIATKDDLARLERKLSGSAAKKSTARKSSPVKKSTSSTASSA